MINNITIATADDITTFSDNVNIYPVDLSGTINTLGNALNWLEKCSYFRPIFFFFFNLLSVILGTHPWPLSVYPEMILFIEIKRADNYSTTSTSAILLFAVNFDLYILSFSIKYCKFIIIREFYFN